MNNKYLGRNGVHNPIEAEKEIGRLRRVSKLQSKNLAQALLEKNQWQAKAIKWESSGQVSEALERRVSQLQNQVTNLSNMLERARGAIDVLKTL